MSFSCVGFTSLTFIISFFKDLSKKWLVSSSYGLIIELSRNKKLQNYRIILSQHTNDLSSLWHVYCCHVYFVFCEILKFVQAKNNILRRAGPPGLAFYGSELVCLPSRLRMVNAGWPISMQSEIFLQMKFIIFQGCPIKQAAFIHGQLTPYNQLLIQSLLLVPECYFA